MRSEPRALHPVSMVLGMPLALLVRSIVLPAAAVLASGLWASVPLVVGVATVWIVGRVLSWQRFRFSFDGDVVRVESGVLQRSHRSVDVARVQQVEIDRPLVQRLLGVATLRIETAGADDEPEIELRVLTEHDAVELRDAVRASRDRARARADASAGSIDVDGQVGREQDSTSPPGVPDAHTILSVPLGRVALTAVTGAQLLVAPALVGGALQLTELRLDELVLGVAERIAALGSTFGSTVLAAVALTTALGVMIVTTLVVGVVRDGRFRVERTGEDLVVRRGLLGTRESTLPLHRIQVVRIVSNPLRRAIGMATVRIHSAGSSGGGDRRRVTVPLLTPAEVTSLIAAVLPSDAPPPPPQAHPRTAVRRAVVRRLIPLAELTGVAALGAVLLGPALREMVRETVRETVRDLLPELVVGRASVPLIGLGLASVLLAVVALGVAEGRALGHATDGRLLVVRHGALMRTVSVVPLARLQAVTHVANWFQRRLGLASVVAHVAGPGGDVRVLDAATEDAGLLRSGLAVAAAGETFSSRGAPSPDRR
jgi:putative membrane protein